MVAILMPAFDEGARLVRTLERVREVAPEVGGVTVFVVDDGSETPVVRGALPPDAPSFSIVLARHVVNLGQGAALETARQLAASRSNAEVFVTMDADGQHTAADVVTLVRAVEAGADVAFGNRFRGGSKVPLARRLLLRAARLFERVLTGLPLDDAHNGLRAFSRRGLDAVAIHQNRMAHATEIKLQVARAAGLAVVEVPVTVRYTAETLEKGQRATGAARIVHDLALRYLVGEAE